MPVFSNVSKNFLACCNALYVEVKSATSATSHDIAPVSGSISVTVDFLPPLISVSPTSIYLRTLTYRVLLEKFNNKYDTLLEPQKEILKELITSIDNTPRLREFHNLKVNEIKESLIDLNTKVTDKVTKIKIEEVVKILPTLSKTSKVKDDDLTNLLQYYDLIEELTNV